MTFKKYAQAIKAIFANKVVILVAKLLATLILFYILLVKVDLSQVKTLLMASNKPLLLLALISCALAQVAASWRLQSFLVNVGIQPGFTYNLKLYFLGLFYNIFLPGGIGGDGVKVYLLQKKFRTRTKRVLMAMIFDRLSGLWAISILGFSLLILIPQAGVPRQYPLLLMIVGTIIYRLIAVRYFKKYSKNFMVTHLKAMLVQGLQLLSILILLLSLDYQGKFAPFLLSFLLAGLVGIINIGFAGFGVRDVTMTYVTEHLAVDPNTGVFLTLAFSLLLIVVSLPGLYYSYRIKEFSLPDKNQEDDDDDDDDDDDEDDLTLASPQTAVNKKNQAF